MKESSAASAQPQSPVRISKKVALQYLSFYQRYRGLDFSALALGNVYGPRQDPHGEAGVIAIFSARMLAGEIPVIFGDGNQTRDYVFIDDVVHAFALGMDRGSGRLLNIGTGVETSVNRLYRMLAESSGSASCRSTARSPPGSCGVSHWIPLAGQALGWRPWTHLEDGLGETVAYLKGI